MPETQIAHETVRITCDSYLSAASALLLVFQDARVTRRTYRFTGLSPRSVLRSGLLLEGEVADILNSIKRIDGCAWNHE